MEETKEKILSDKMSGLTEDACDAINEQLSAVGDSDVNEALEVFENDPDVQKLKEQQEELLRLMANPKVMKAYKAYTDARAVGERRPVSQKEKKKKKAKRRMAKKSKRK